MALTENQALRFTKLSKSGIQALQRGNLPLAEQHLREALDIDPDSADVLCNLAAALQSKGDAASALDLYQRAIEIDPSKASAYSNWGVLLQSENKHTEAIGKFQEALKRDSSNASFYDNLGISFRALRKYDQAIAAFKSALAIQPKNPAILHNLSRAYRNIKNLEQAIRYNQESIEANPHNCQTHKDLCHLPGYAVTKPHLNQMLELYRNPKIVAKQRILICFALAKALRSVGDFKASAKLYDEGNRLGLKLVGPIRHETDLYDPSRLGWVDSLEDGAPLEKDSDYTPLFVMGLPRSGKSTFERILGQSHRVTEGGEIGFPLDWINCRADLSSSIERAEAGSIKYFQKLRDFYPNSEYVVDTLGFNILSLGIIKKRIPNSRFVFCVRDPIENAIAVYQKYLKKPLHSYSFSLKEIATHFRMHSKLMAYWIDYLGEDCVVVDSDKLFADPVSEAKKAFSVCGLEFDKRYVPKFVSPGETDLTSSSKLAIVKESYRLSDAYSAEAAEMERHLSASAEETASQDA